MRLPAGATLATMGTPADPGVDFIIPLHVGWNLVGDPFLVSVPVGRSRVLLRMAALLDSIEARIGSDVYGYT